MTKALSESRAWMQPYYAGLAQRREFALLSASHRFELLVNAFADEHPTEAAEMRVADSTTRDAILGWLADVTKKRPPAAREIDPWRLRKAQRELRCVMVGQSTGIDLRLLEGLNFRRTELVRDALAVEARASEWKQRLQQRGWI